MDIPVDDPIRRELLDPIISATCVTLHEMAGVEAVARGVRRKPPGELSGDISVVLKLKSATDTCLILSFPMGTAHALAQRVLQGVVDVPDDNMVGDCLAEIANVVGGQAKTLLAETPYHFTFSLPQVASAANPVPPTPCRACFVIDFGSSAGPFAVQWLHIRDQPAQ